MNWLRRAFINSTPSWVNSGSFQVARGEPGSLAATLNKDGTASSPISRTRRSGSTSICQSRSVTLFHWELIALLYSVTSCALSRS